MTLTEAIERYTSNAEYERIHGNLQGCLDFRQLAEWLKDYKRLLEREPVLDKIKDKIRALTDGAEPEHIWNIDALAIIDEYKAESEG